jgi:hypothetical protein
MTPQPLPRLSIKAHVEAVSIMRALLIGLERGTISGDAIAAAEVWLRENHPKPEEYIAAMEESSHAAT